MIKVLPKLKVIFTILFLILITTNSCKQIVQASRLADCEYELASITKTKLAGVSIQNIKEISDLSLTDAGRITLALKSDHLPLRFTLNLEITNPNSKLAALNQVLWIVLMEDREIAKGAITERTEVAPNSKTILPINIAVDLNEVFSSESGISLFKMILKYMGLTSAKTKISLRIKPVIQIGKKLVKSPTYIKVSQSL